MSQPQGDPAEPEGMDCQEVVELVTDYLEGVLDANMVARFDAHLALCTGCEVYLAQIRDSIAATGSIRAENLPAATVDALVEAFRGVRRP